MVPPNGHTLVAARGRGAKSNATGRFESLVREAFDDGWTDLDEAPAPLKTEVTAEKAKVIISRNTSPDVGFDRSINPYRGCEHGCIYWAVTHFLRPPERPRSRVRAKGLCEAGIRVAVGAAGH